MCIKLYVCPRRLVPSGTPTLCAALWWQQIRPLGWCPAHTVSHKWTEIPCPTQCSISEKFPGGLWKKHSHRSVGGSDQYWHSLIVVWPGTPVLTVHGLPNCIHVCVRCICHSGCEDCVTIPEIKPPELLRLQILDLFYAALTFITSYFKWKITATIMDANGGCAKEITSGSDDTGLLFWLVPRNFRPNFYWPALFTC